MAENEEELKSLLMKVKEESGKTDLKLSIQKPKIMASGPITSWLINGGKVETVVDFIFLVSKITVDSDCSHEINLVQFSSVTQLCPTLCDPMTHSMPGLPVHHQLPESTQTHVHCVGDAIQPSHSLLTPSPPALNLSQPQGLLK